MVSSMTPLALLVAPSLAATIMVDPSGALATVQAAVEVALPGDTIQVPAGTFPGCVDLGGRDLSIVGAGAGHTSLDGRGCPELIRARNGEQLTLRDLHLTNSGGRCVAVLGGRLDLVDSVVEACGAADISGSGIWSRQAETAISGSLVTGNLGYEGVGLLARNGGTLLVRNSTFRGNMATEQGAAIYGNIDIEGTIEDSVFEANESPDRVAGAVAWHLGRLTIARTTFTQNRAALYGGALYPHHVSEGVVLEDVVFEGNTATDGDGGAIATSMGTILTLRRTRFTGNEARDGGAAWISTGSLSVEEGWFEANTAETRGGALAATDEATTTTHATTFCDNAAAEGGSIHFQGGTHRLANSTLVRGTAPTSGGAVSAVLADLTLEWLSVVGSTAPDSAAIDARGGPIELHSSLIAHTTEGAGLQVIYGAVTGGWNALWDNAGGDVVGDAGLPHDADVLAEPALLDWRRDSPCEALDLRLQRGSPLVDAGHPDSQDPDGSRADIGAWGGPDATWADEDGDGDAYPVDCDDTDPSIGPDCTEREEPDSGAPDTGPTTEDTGGGRETGTTPDVPRDEAGTEGSKPSASGCGEGGAATAIPLLLLGLQHRRRRLSRARAANRLP